VPTIRPLEADDAPELLVLRQANAEFLAPFEPVRGHGFLTLVGQHESIADQVARRAAGSSASYVIVEDGAIVGQVTLSSIVSWPHLSANLGYWVAERCCGRGVGSAAVAAVCAEAFGTLGLHRVQAGTLVDNLASQRVLERNGFRRIGLAQRYLLIAGEWRDHVLFELLADG
jgi:ribosomal-protein-alanine N-acetyltransferase